MVSSSPKKNNTRLHTSSRTCNKVEALEEIELVTHIPYSPDLALSGYPFHFMRICFRGRRFSNVDDLQRRYQNSVVQLERRYVESMEFHGLYFDLRLAYFTLKCCNKDLMRFLLF